MHVYSICYFFLLLLCILLSSCQTIFSTTSRCNAWKAAKVLCTRMGMFVYLVVTTLVAWKPTKAKQSTQRVYVQCIAARVKKRDKVQRNRNKLRRERENARSSTIRTKQRTRLRFWVEKIKCISQCTLDSQCKPSNTFSFRVTSFFILALCVSSCFSSATSLPCCQWKIFS